MWGFNTQPPEGGWDTKAQAAEESAVSTHSRPKAAVLRQACRQMMWRFQHTAARRRLIGNGAGFCCGNCFNTQPPEGGCIASPGYQWPDSVSTHSRPKAAGIDLIIIL
ncbi:hypothetical protein l13_04430 [Neisseria weaveri ATCC 51223]|nr:hypothetical protein l13_04430 [Neisseria weaveri ATCC 51223]